MADTGDASPAAQAASNCEVWVGCFDAERCGAHLGECWLKRSADRGAALPAVRSSDRRWTGGVNCAPGARFDAEGLAEAIAARDEARAARRVRKGNPVLYLDVQLANNEEPRRMVLVGYAHEAPNGAENLRLMCTGEKGGDYTLVGASFYRVIDMFIDQTGKNVRGGGSALTGGQFKDDPGGLALRHDRAGLLSAANMGPDTNTGHFSIVVAPAPHLDGHYTIFGEVVNGHDVMWAINALANSKKDTAPTYSAAIVGAGQLGWMDGSGGWVTERPV